jgi:hypothetical protein
MSDALSDDLLAGLDPVAVFERALGLAPMPHQVDYLRSSEPILALKGRQTGFTTAAAVKAIHACWYRPNILAAIVSPSLRQSTVVATIARQGLRALGARLAADSASMIRLANGSAILSLPGTAKSVRGWSAQILVLDEAAYVEPDTWTAARALVATGGQLIVQSTPAGQSGDFWELCRANDPAWRRFVVRSDEVPTISTAFLEGERRAMGPDAYAAEYECQFGRAVAGLFSADRLAGLILPETEV